MPFAKSVASPLRVLRDFVVKTPFPWPILQKTDPERWVRFWLSKMNFPHRLDQTWLRFAKSSPREATTSCLGRNYFFAETRPMAEFVNHGTTRVSAVGGLPAGWWRKPSWTRRRSAPLRQRPCLWCRPVVAALAKRGPATSWLLATGYCATSLISKPSRWERRDATPKVYPDSEVGATRRASRAGASECKTIRYIKDTSPILPHPPPRVEQELSLKDRPIYPASRAASPPL